MTQDALENRFMEFAVGDQALALPLTCVREVIPKPDVTALPGMPQYFEGMINLRGKVIGVISLKKKLSIKSERPAEALSVVIVVEHDGMSVGMIVDEVVRVIQTNPEMMKEAPLKQDDPLKRYVNAVIQTKERMVLAVNEIELLEFQQLKSKLVG